MPIGVMCVALVWGDPCHGTSVRPFSYCDLLRLAYCTDTVRGGTAKKQCTPFKEGQTYLYAAMSELGDD